LVAAEPKPGKDFTKQGSKRAGKDRVTEADKEGREQSFIDKKAARKLLFLARHNID